MIDNTKPTTIAVGFVFVFRTTLMEKCAIAFENPLIGILFIKTKNMDLWKDEIRNLRTNYVFRTDGTKLRKEYTSFFKGGSERTSTTDYLDGFQYTVNHLGTVTLEFVPTSEGYYDFKNNRYIYNYTDHWGNTRLSYFKNAGGSAKVLEENNYYPFGLKHEGYNALAGNPSYQYNYNGKEVQNETGMIDYGWRQYMPEIGRWNGMDQLAEMYVSTSTYGRPYSCVVWKK